MAVTKLWPVKSNLSHVINYAANKEKTSVNAYTDEQYQALRDVLSYAKNEEKTEREFYVQGINCNPSTARDQFITVKEQFGKTDGIQAYHGYISFKNMEVTPEMAQRVGMEFAQRVWGKKYQVIVTTHLNTEHLHCHFVINSISFVDGRRCHDETSWFKFSPIADEICQKYGLSVVQEPERNRDPYYITKKEQAGIPTRQSILRETIDEIIPHCRNIDDFKYQLHKRGYRYNLTPSRKYWTVTPPGSEKSIRLYRLGNEYTNDRIIERIRESFESGKYTPPEKDSGYRHQYRLPSREQKLYQQTSLYRKYLYYCYKLGYLPKQQNRKPKRVHYLLRDDLIKLDRISQEVRLLGKYQIDNSEQLFSFSEKCTEKLKDLDSVRTDLRKELRRVPEDEREPLKQEISAISTEIKELRKNISLCESIAERSRVIEPKLEQIHREELEDKDRHSPKRVFE